MRTLGLVVSLASMSDVVERARAWIEADPDPVTRDLLNRIIESGDVETLERHMNGSLTFGTAGIRGVVGPGPAMMNRAVVIRTTSGLATYLGRPDRPVVVGFDARPSSRQFAEDAVGVLAAAGIETLYFPDLTPTPLVAFTARDLDAIAAVVVTASHNPPADNGYKVYGPESSQIVSPMDRDIQAAIEKAPPANEVPRIEEAFAGTSDKAGPVPSDMLDRYWEGVSSVRSRSKGSDLRVVYTPMHGVGKKTVFEIMRRAGHTGYVAVPEQAEPDGTFPTVAFPNPEEPGALDLALAMARTIDADLLVANDPDADRLAVVVPHNDGWRALSGNEVGALLGDYVLSHDQDPSSAAVVSSIVSSPMLGEIASAYRSAWEQTLTGFKWICRAGMTLENTAGQRFVFGYEEALGYMVGPTVRDKDGMSAALIFTDLVADLADEGLSVVDRLHELWQKHGLWVSAQATITREGPEGVRALLEAVGRLADDPPESIDGVGVSEVVDYRLGAGDRPEWLGEQDLVELTLGEEGRILVRPSGTEPKLKIYVDLRGTVSEGDVDVQQERLVERAGMLGAWLAGSLGV